MKLTGADLRVARISLGLKQADLAFVTGLSEITLRRLEAADAGFAGIKSATVEQVCSALADRGIEFTPGGMIGRHGETLAALGPDVVGADIRRMRLSLGVSLGRVAREARLSDEAVRQIEAAGRFSPRQAGSAAIVWAALQLLADSRTD